MRIYMEGIFPVVQLSWLEWYSKLLEEKDTEIPPCHKFFIGLNIFKSAGSSRLQKVSNQKKGI